jgi:hypothetical protein
MYVRTSVTVSSSPSSRRERWAGEEQGCDWERAAKVSGASGGGGGENAHVVDLSSEEPNMNGAVTVFKEITGVPLTALCSNWNFMGTIVNIGGKF